MASRCAEHLLLISLITFTVTVRFNLVMLFTVGAKDKQASGHKSSTTADKGEKESNEVTSTSHRVSRKDNKSRKERFKRRRHSLSSRLDSSHPFVSHAYIHWLTALTLTVQTPRVHILIMSLSVH